MAQDALLNSIVLSTFQFPSNEIINLLFGWTDVPTLALLLIFEFSGHNKAFFSKEGFRHLLGKGIYLKSSVTKMSYCPSLLPDDHIFFVDNSYQYRIPPSNIINGHFKTNNGMGIGFIDTLFVDPKQFKIFSLPTIIQLPNGR